jgi:hypothetical protein
LTAGLRDYSEALWYFKNIMICKDDIALKDLPKGKDKLSGSKVEIRRKISKLSKIFINSYAPRFFQ